MEAVDIAVSDHPFLARQSTMKEAVETSVGSRGGLWRGGPGKEERTKNRDNRAAHIEDFIALGAQLRATSVSSLALTDGAYDRFRNVAPSACLTLMPDLKDSRGCFYEGGV
ncbi:hypothetical protein NHN26_15055 [Rhodovulum tesquicola]|uniref:hypothetical protein n=1 Tax=Rhodovulum tesquicola TaxID=540254 RepID=UPI002097B269|nr:hypothetical protein [Rhodovulum tesquicola]MCO8146538.1 hypothetical protein [Rhodovulum tesquicola]